MYGMLVCAMFAAAQDAEQPRRIAPADRAVAPVSLDGTWTVLCAEKDGQPMAEAKFKTVSIRNNVITCDSAENHDLKVMKVEFGPNATVRVTDMSNQSARSDTDRANTGRDAAKSDRIKTGVSVMTKDYLSICIHDDAMHSPQAHASGDGSRTALKPVENFTPQPQTKSHFTIILKRGTKE